jgi:hypothetical protein
MRKTAKSIIWHLLSVLPVINFMTYMFIVLADHVVNVFNCILPWSHTAKKGNDKKRQNSNLKKLL